LSPQRGRPARHVVANADGRSIHYANAAPSFSDTASDAATVRNHVANVFADRDADANRNADRDANSSEHGRAG
jgi:hypothetical protein